MDTLQFISEVATFIIRSISHYFTDLISAFEISFTIISDVYYQVTGFDLSVFTLLELLGFVAIFGNVLLITVLVKFNYLNKASFTLLLSLALADLLHGIVTTSYFYPPIILKRQHLSLLWMKIFSAMDWTAWGITLTHISAVCLDRLAAVMFYGRYSTLVSMKRVRTYSLFCWVFFMTYNATLLLLDACCMIIPMKNYEYYSFGYQSYDTWCTNSNIPNQTNIYIYSYTPMELSTLIILSVTNPIILTQLYRRWKRKCALQHASVLLVEMSMKLGAQHSRIGLTKMSMRKANRQQQRIVLKISTVAVIFSCYMLIYYLSFHVFAYGYKWVAVLHSVCYSVTHISNPIIYFTCNKDMREQLLSLWIHLWQNFLGYNRALLTGRYQLALTSAGQEQSVRHLPTVESRSKKRQHHSATTTADITLTLSTSITGDVDALLNLKEQEEEQQRRRKKVRCNSSIN